MAVYVNNRNPYILYLVILQLNREMHVTRMCKFNVLLATLVSDRMALVHLFFFLPESYIYTLCRILSYVQSLYTVLHSSVLAADHGMYMLKSDHKRVIPAIII